MLYLNTKDIENIGIDWHRTVEVIEDAVTSLHRNDFSQPIKPYLKFNDPINRIIAMPAYVGGDISTAGIKWIASFPKNIQQGIQRAHSVTILNDAQTGKPLATINTALVSGIRTASVSGLMIKYFEQVRELKDINLGIIGFGPIGQLHLQMATALLGSKISNVFLYDISGVKSELIPAEIKERTTVVQTWQEAYETADVFMTCTVSPEGYIDQQPKAGSLQLNVSLRDFKPEILDYTQSIIVDDWDEVCRANTDIELMHKQRGLQKEATKSIAEVVCEGAMNTFPEQDAIVFNPMGMAIFDVAIATVYYRDALAKGIGTQLED